MLACGKIQAGRTGVLSVTVLVFEPIVLHLAR
jgi:hypothetical protein